ncbi:hypothetical protein EI546_09590 [Aequorivita sp. H23M31]|uniref:Uncharacterized protein n=1 Tax=Aequorivita ciconiae TaxID=2494375 RepID=A0A410G3Y9_9FLAO|nr:hypothetical protein [Aequorivita sp. H23M31]QAA81951.1 hypothetical protein EI546_09545 [Aequorivita sp. H23M31]QAA81959.1 hypothetical protein EI546_09590 [Aequorivita sp. H23M31]
MPLGSHPDRSGKSSAPPASLSTPIGTEKSTPVADPYGKTIQIRPSAEVRAEPQRTGFIFQTYQPKF